MDAFEGLTAEQIEVIRKSRRRVMDSIGNNMDLYGVTLSIGHLYGNIYFHDGPVTLDEMREVMGMSKTSMSTGMRTLIDLKMVNKVWEKGSRKDLYEVETDWHQNFVDYFVIKWRKSMEVNIASLNKSTADIHKLRAADPDNEALIAQTDFDLARMQHAVQYYKWLSRFIDALESGEIFKWIPKEDEKEDEQQSPGG
ncbi:GbsR/MarR family transcriptional regulator [Paenibacillus sp. IB182496]|uniref:HTH-type transcriptional regulator n=1 Tax=Paenibacillus sabuli TaxID=2772509 RepID=A0A927BRC1_9BACL|nr:GbsR/MarR family transcriptional regulator [Paenibacillus sabuli]MBD2844852.1 GbsR/MarR family transcriptional regulator [Paenibacillus sabuli]